jgi:hypothetical protein
LYKDYEGGNVNVKNFFIFLGDHLGNNLFINDRDRDSDKFWDRLVLVPVHRVHNLLFFVFLADKSPDHQNLNKKTTGKFKKAGGF